MPSKYPEEKSWISEKLNTVADEIIDMVLGTSTQGELSEHPNYQRWRIGALLLPTLIFIIAIYLLYYLVAPAAPDNSVSNNKNIGIIQDLPQADIDYAKLEDVKSNSYRIGVLPDYEDKNKEEDELVKGYKGKYYVIDLKYLTLDGADYRDTILYFEKGKYYIDDTERYFKFLEAFDNFVNQVVDKITRQGNVEYELFVRGSAD